MTLSLGGATGAAGFTNDSQAEAFADTIWNLFLGGSSPIRPLGPAILGKLSPAGLHLKQSLQTV